VTISSLIVCHGLHRPVLAQGLVDESLPKTWQQQATLRDVCFIGTDHGWAVGDHGVILKTVDQGEHWITVADANRAIEDWNHAAGQVSLKEKLLGVQQRRVQTGASTSISSAPKVSCQLNTVFFLNQNLGWAAGGYAVPLLNRTRSVVLKTVDGGANWRVVSNTMPPHIKQIQFSDPNTGWAIGDCSSSFGSGIYLTRDGGQTWQSHRLSERRQRHRWARADRQNQQMIGVSQSGELKFTNSNRIEASGVLASSKQEFNDVVMVDRDQGWAVGNFGAIFQTHDAGLSWKALALPQEHSLPLTLIDLQSLATTSSLSKIWAAGRPGGCLVSIEKKSGAVNLHATPIRSAIHSIHFADPLRGWAVGDLGIVIATTDGGETWQIQRGTQTRVGCLNVCFDQDELPLELLAQLACEDDVLCATAMFSAIDTHTHQSASRCGNAVLESLNLPDVQGAHQQQAAVIRKLVTAIRIHQPQFIVLNPSIDQSIADTLDREKLLQLAVHRAADATFESQRFEAVGLKPWQVQRMAIGDVAGMMSVGLDKFLPNLAATIADRVFVSRSLLGMGLPTSTSLRYRVVRFLGRGAGGQSTTTVPIDGDLMTGLHAVPRRMKTQHPPGSLSMIGRRNQKRETFKRILKSDVHDGASMLAWQNEMLNLMLMADRSTAGNWIFELADECFAVNQPELAAKALDFLVQRLPEHAYTPSALLWLSHYYASQEYAWRWFNQRGRGSTQFDSSKIVTAEFNAPSAAKEPLDRVTSLQISDADNGGQQLAWAVPDADRLKQKIEHARQVRLADDAQSYNAAERKLFELGDAIAGKSMPSDRLTSEAAEIGHVDPFHKADNINSEEVQSHAAHSAAVEPTEPENSWGEFVAERRQRSAKYLARLRGRDPDLALSPETIAVEVSLLSSSTQPEKAIERLQQLANAIHPNDSHDPSTTSSSALSQTIAREIAIIQGQKVGEVVRCMSADNRPKLDGKFDDDLWQVCLAEKAFEQINRSDVVLFGYDNEFLYLIARVKKRDDYNYSFDKKPRTRDANLNNRDRIIISLDCDRDQRTKFQLVIDHRGWVHESFDAVTDWDPKWYISQSQDTTSWTVEAAIPLAAFEFQTNLIETKGPQSLSPTSLMDRRRPWTIQLQRRIRGNDLWDRDVSDALEEHVTSNQRNGGRSMLDLIGPGTDGPLFVFE
jgi:photosystem II stability/assembly factor-like uncharacterized protein